MTKIPIEQQQNFELAKQATHHVLLEVMDSYEKFPDFNSHHEGYAVLLEEVEELWDEIKTKEKDLRNIEEEAVQVGAMAVKFLIFMKKQAMDNGKN